jgi:RNA polymerase sigma factor (sigma-70 family)
MTAPVIRDYLKVLGNATAGADDADLVARFAATRDQAAFELLVWRHAALVQRVCQAVLRDHHAAEDAAQATFLVLARKAGSFGGRRSVVGWLYRVSRRVSMRLARQRVRVPVGAAALDGLPAPEAADVADDSAHVLCEEIDHLPEEYRVPVLLCFFEGLTHAEAAHRTGWPVGTVAGRLARAKGLLARRLLRRGVGLGAVALPVASATFVGSTVRAATAFAVGTPAAGLVTPTVLSLAQGASATMTTTLLKLSAAAAVVLCAVTAGVWGLSPAPASQTSGSGGAPGTAPGGAGSPLRAGDVGGGAAGPDDAKPATPAATPDEPKAKVSVDFRDIHRDGKVAVVGHFGIPIGQNVTVEGRRAKASKVSDEMTLHVAKVNGVAAARRGESPLVQMQNVDSLPEDETIIVEGYEFLSWRGDPDINWHVEVDFMITKVVAPKGLKVNARKP